MATLVHSLLSVTTTCINTSTITLINPYYSSSSSSSSSAFPLHQLRLIPSINRNTRTTTLNMSLPTSQNPGGNVVLLYASKYHDIHMVVNVSGRYNLEKGIEERLGKNFIERTKKEGYLDVENKKGEVLFRVTEESLMDRLNTKMHDACLQIDKNCRVLTVHGSADEIIPLEDALEFAKIIPNRKLHIIEEANHVYTKHQAELISVVLPFIKGA